MSFGSVPDVSVCVATYNHEDYIFDCIMSVLMQSGDVSLEIIVGDDHSSDNTFTILQLLESKHPEYISVIRHDSRLGYGSANLKSLLPHARGRYIAHLDGDDFWLPAKLREQVRFLDENPDCSAVCSNALCFGGEGRLIGVFNNPQKVDRFSLDELLESGNFLNHSSLLYRSELKNLVSDLPAPFLDYKVHLIMAGIGHMGYIDKPLTGYRIGSASSAIAQRGDFVRSLYWETIRGVAAKAVNPSSKLTASADFLRRVLFRAVRARSWRLFKDWFLVVSSEHKNNFTKLMLLLMKNIFISFFREVSSYCFALIGRTRLRIVYWR